MKQYMPCTCLPQNDLATYILTSRLENPCPVGIPGCSLYAQFEQGRPTFPAPAREWFRGLFLRFSSPALALSLVQQPVPQQACEQPIVINHTHTCAQGMGFGGHSLHVFDHILAKVAARVSPISALRHIVVYEVFKMMNFGSKMVS